MVLTNLMGNGKNKKMNRKPLGLKLIDIDEIKPNEHNKFEIEGINELMDSILEYGLRKPLDVYKEDDFYRISDGERRYTALKQLVDEGKIEPEISCIIYEAPTDNINDRLQLILANATRIMTKEEKIKVVEELLEIYECLDPKPKGKKRDWIAPFIGAKSGRSVQEYLNIIDRKNNIKSQIEIEGAVQIEKQTKQKKEYTLYELFKDFSRIMKKLEAMEDKTDEFNLSMIKIAETETNEDILVQDSIRSLRRMITKFNNCVQRTIEMDESPNNKNKENDILEGQTNINDFVN